MKRWILNRPDFWKMTHVKDHGDLKICTMEEKEFGRVLKESLKGRIVPVVDGVPIIYLPAGCHVYMITKEKKV